MAVACKESCGSRGGIKKSSVNYPEPGRRLVLDVLGFAKIITLRLLSLYL